MTKKERKERKKRLKSLILLLFLTIVLLTTSTYAWFTANRSVSIDPIDVYIAASSGLLISTDAADWKTIISNEDITSPGGWTTHKNMLPYNLVPVSTAGNVTGGYMDFFKGTVEAAASNGNAMSLTAVATPAEKSYVYTLNGTTRTYPTLAEGEEAPNFIAFDIFLRNDDTVNADVYLTNGSGVLSTENQDDKGLQNAARYAFVQEGNGNASTPAATARSWTGGTSSIIVEPNFDMHTATGVLAAQNSYSQTTVAATADTPALPYYGVQAAISSPIVLVNTNAGGSPSGDYFKVPTNLIRTNKAYSEGTTSKKSYTGETTSANLDTNLHKMFTLSPGVTKFRVYMWVEGQDVDCENSASGAFLTFKLGFKLDNE